MPAAARSGDHPDRRLRTQEVDAALDPRWFELDVAVEEQDEGAGRERDSTIARYGRPAGFHSRAGRAIV